MVNKEQFKNGFLKYIDSEIIPRLPTTGKWGIGTAIILATSNYDSIYERLVNNEIVRTLGIVNDDKCIDLDRLADAMKVSASKYGKMQISVPIVGTMYFSSEDVDKLRNCINAEVYG